jgi:hypothetical protein
MQASFALPSAGFPAAVRTLFILLVLLAIPVTVVRAEDDARKAELARIARETAELRGLPPLEEIDDVLMTRDELLGRMPEIMAEDYAPEDAAADSQGLAALGLVPAGTDLFALSVRLMGEQAAGYYDPVADEMIVIADGDLDAEAYFYSHEVVHALQDAYLDPDDLLEDRTALNDDQALAVLALYEGDAVKGSNAYLANHPNLATALLGEAETDFPELEQAPAVVSVTLLFPYSEGERFVDRLYREGGWEAVNAAYDDLPSSSEQILHPGKYLARDEPVTVTLPEPATLGTGWQIVDEDTLGELQTSLLLAHLAPGKGIDEWTGALRVPEAARNAAAGWDGDRYALWRDEASGREALVWWTAWDTPQDARAFAAALAKFEASRWQGDFVGGSANDVALVTPEIAARILLAGQEVFYVQASDRPLADAALAALRAASPPDPAPGPN